MYTASPEWRNRFRSTAFHNTIRVDSEEINRFPSSLALFSLRDDARPLEVRWAPGVESEIFEAGHTGYRRLADPVTVRRRFEFDRRLPCLRLTDSLEGKREHRMEFFFHAAPGARPVRLNESSVAFHWPDGTQVTIEKSSGADVAWESRPGWFSPSYGVRMERPIWVASASARLPLAFGWMLSAGLGAL